MMSNVIGNNQGSVESKETGERSTLSDPLIEPTTKKTYSNDTLSEIKHDFVEILKDFKQNDKENQAAYDSMLATVQESSKCFSDVIKILEDETKESAEIRETNAYFESRDLITLQIKDIENCFHEGATFINFSMLS